MRTCIGPCGKELDESCFDKGRNDSQRNVCKICLNKQRTPENLSKRNAWSAEYQRRYRVDRPAMAIFYDSRKSDRKHSRGNDLDLPFIESLISNSCSYCGETSLRMTLDRTNNNLGHLKSNVVPACIRCNYARGNMPYGAWVCLIPGMRKAREEGMFGSWVGGVTQSRSDQLCRDSGA